MSAAAEVLREAHARYRAAIGTPHEARELAALEATTRLVLAAEQAREKIAAMAAAMTVTS